MKERGGGGVCVCLQLSTGKYMHVKEINNLDNTKMKGITKLYGYIYIYTQHKKKPDKKDPPFS